MTKDTNPLKHKGSKLPWAWIIGATVGSSLVLGGIAIFLVNTIVDGEFSGLLELRIDKDNGMYMKVDSRKASGSEDTGQDSEADKDTGQDSKNQ